MFYLLKPISRQKDDSVEVWKEFDSDEDYGVLLRRNLVAGYTVGAVNFGMEITYIININGSVLKVEYRA